MPPGWHNSYAYYYDSPRYINRYVPAEQRASTLESMKGYERDHAAEIKTASKTATYKDSTGRTYTGKSLSPSTLGGGARGGAGGGSRTKTCGLPVLKGGSVLARGSSGGGSSGGRLARRLLMTDVPINPLESIHAEKYTVFGFCHETWER